LDARCEILLPGLLLGFIPSIVGGEHAATKPSRQCYFNKRVEHPMCEFNRAVTVREGYSGNVDRRNAKYWLTGGISDKWGTEKKGIWVVVSFDPKTTKEQRDALAPIMLKTYGLEWPELKKLKREPGAEGKGVVLKNVKYFNAVQNDGFQLYRSDTSSDRPIERAW